MTRQERRELADRLRKTIKKRYKTRGLETRYPPDSSPVAVKLAEQLTRIGIAPEPWELGALISGSVVDFGAGHTFKITAGRLIYLG
ncbi:hypothetical protein [Erwinia endophytica]|uniref:hypothetical protein n=1 Tax=Erwinia endophytica TaxID=1563158 RepID=UPI001F042853|nr:hypothetical protein [Erwinia endophytica]